MDLDDQRCIQTPPAVIVIPNMAAPEPESEINMIDTTIQPVEINNVNQETPSLKASSEIHILPTPSVTTSTPLLKNSRKNGVISFQMVGNTFDAKPAAVASPGIVPPPQAPTQPPAKQAPQQQVSSPVTPAQQTVQKAEICRPALGKLVNSAPSSNVRPSPLSKTEIQSHWSLPSKMTLGELVALKRENERISGTERSYSGRPRAIPTHTKQQKEQSTESPQDDIMDGLLSEMNKPSTSGLSSVSTDRDKPAVQPKKQSAPGRTSSGQKFGKSGPKDASSGKSASKKVVKTTSGINALSNLSFSSFKALSEKKAAEEERKRQEALNAAAREREPAPEPGSMEYALSKFNVQAALNDAWIGHTEANLEKSIDICDKGELVQV